MGIDLAGKAKNPTGIALWKAKQVKSLLLYSDEEILDYVLQNKPALIAIDAPLSFPKEGMLRTAEKEMLRRGYRIFPPVLPMMKMLTSRASKLNKLIAEEGYKTIEVHPTSTRKALDMPLKDWPEIQKTFKNLELQGTLSKRPLSYHEIDAVTAALTAHLHTKNKTESIGNEQEGYVVIPKRCNWRKLQL
ncbi:DUF429 domain-containing protein [Candidatus Bathyarchaeota archaeon]|nr:DUF429 domain-containing protein [Candidatus Bathyarchaeota archaeon]